MDYTKQQLTDASVVLWILDNKFVSETGKPIEFTQHRFMIDYLHDQHPHKVSLKSSQIGETVMELFDDFHLVGKKHLNVAHTMHTSDVLQSFVRPKVNPLIQNNPAIRALMTTDSEGLKGFGSNFLFLRGANAESQAISFSADVLKIDEKDRSNLSVVEMFQSRMDFSEFRWIREFSNPSAKGIGVDATFQRSDQRHWFVKCPACGYERHIDFEQDTDMLSHFVDREHAEDGVVKPIYVCGNPECWHELSNADRIRGRWVAKWPSRDKIHGYWFSQMMAPWFSAAQIVDKFENNSIEYFYNFVLGKPYTAANLEFSRETILRACRPGVPYRRGVVMGSDIGNPHWYWLGNASGVFEIGHAASWEDLERIFLSNNCDAWVADAQPEFTEVQRMIRKYPGKFYACRYVQDTKGVGIVRWQSGDLSGFVYADRTKIIDRLVQEVTEGSIRFMMQPSGLEELIKHAANIYRRVETDEKGKTSIDWLTVGKNDGDTGGAKPDHLVHAGVYWRIALEQSLSGTGFVNDTSELAATVPEAPTVRGGKIQVKFDIEESLDRAKNTMIRS